MSLLTRFSQRIGDSDWMNTPEEYLGPNYQAVIDWWTYLDYLSNNDQPTYNKIETLDHVINTRSISQTLSSYIIYPHSYDCVHVIMDRHNLRMITYELIAMHKLSEINYDFPYIKLLEKL